jgi:hypothetical protein
VNPSKITIPSKKNLDRQRFAEGFNSGVNDLKIRRAVSPSKIKIPSKKSRQAVLRGGI